MQLERSLGSIIALGFMVAISACASGSQGGADTETPAAGAGAGSPQAIRVVVENNRPGGGTVTMFMVPDVGVRRSLGEVEPGATGTFNYQGAPGPYRLLAQGGAGDVTSSSFRIYENTGEVRWNMSSSNVIVQTRR